MLRLKIVGQAGALAMLGLVFAAALSSAPPYTGYANSPYTTGTGSADYMDDVVIKRGSTVLLQNMNTGGGASPYNTYYGSISPAMLIPAQSHSIEITVSPSWGQGMTAWIDYNNDGTFNDTTERIGYTANIAAGGTGIITFTPASGASGVCRLRIRCVYATSGPHAVATSYTYGEAEDYLVNLGFTISTMSPLPAAAVNTAYQTDIVATNGTAPYNWQGSPSYLIAGALPAGLTASVVGTPAALRISGTPTATGTSTFTVSVTDSAATPSNSQKQFQITVVPPPAAMPFLDDFSTDKGWQIATPWARGPAVSFTQTTPACSEPGTDHTAATTDNMILGDTIGNKYAANNSTVYFTISPMVNCASATNVRLRYWYWLGLAIGSTVQIDVTNNGSTWTNVWTSTNGSTYGGTITPVWTSTSFDITATAAGNATVQVRFGIGPTGATNLTGWCIDDFLIEEPTSDMLVQETGSTGPVITDNQTVGGGRDFGMVNVSQQSSPLTIYITNNGPTNITFGTFTKVGAQPADFYLNASALTNPLPPAQSTSFTITFYRTTVGVSTCTLEIPHNALYSGSTPFQINLRGEAIQPIPVIEVRLGTTTGPVIPHQNPAAGTPRDFGNQDISAGPTAAVTIVVLNTGTGPLGVSTPDMGGTWWTEFVVNSTGWPSTIAPGANASFTVAFDPGSIGTKDAFVRIPHTDGSQASPYLVPVLGNATSPGPTLGVNAGGSAVAHNAAAAGTTRDFGSQNINAGPTAPLTITINNTGTGSLTVSTPVLGGPDAGEFTIDTTGFASPIAAAGSTSFTVEFDPTSIGQKNATVSFTHNDPNATSPFIINITGNGVTTAPTIVVREVGPGGTQLTNPAPATGALDFGNWDINSGASAPVTIYVENTGTSSLTVAAPAFNPATTEFQLQSTGFAGTVAVGSSATFTITFDPTALGQQNAVIEFTHNDTAAGSPFVLNITGNGILNSPLIDVFENSTTGPAVASSQPANLGGGRDFGNLDVSAGVSTPITIVILNNGTIDLNLGNPTLGGPNASSFILNTAGFNNVVAAGGSTSFSLTFDPTLGGYKDAQVEFTQDDSTQPTPFIVMFRGTAVDPNGVLITSTSLTPGVAGVQYTPEQLNAIQGAAPYTWSLYSGNMPAGLTMSSAGVVSGKPTGYGGVFKMVIRATDQNGATDEETIVLVVSGNLEGRGKAKAGGACTAEESGSVPVFALLAILAAAAGISLRRREG